VGTWLLAVCLLGCNQDGYDYDQVNATDDVVSIEVGAELSPLVTLDLHSSTGRVVIGTVTVDPGGGPAETEHEVYVTMLEEYVGLVDHASVSTSSEGRGSREFEMDPDSAEEGLFKLVIVSVADDGEVRTDSFTIQLWEFIEDDELLSFLPSL
jgi:hypothetical protein